MKKIVILNLLSALLVFGSAHAESKYYQLAPNCQIKKYEKNAWVSSNADILQNAKIEPVLRQGTVSFKVDGVWYSTTESCLKMTNGDNLPPPPSSREDFKNEQEIILRFKGAYALTSKIDPVKSSKGGGFDVDFAFTENFGITGSFFYLVGSDSSRNTITSLTTDSSIKSLLFGGGPRYMIKKNNLRAYIGAQLGFLNVAVNQSSYSGSNSATAVSVSSSSTYFAYGPVFGVDFPISGSFGLGMQIQYMNSSKAAFANFMGGLSFIL